MRRLGMSEEQIQQIEDRQAELLGGDEDDEDEDDQDDDLHPVLEENWDAAQIFLRLHLARQVDQGVAVYTGVETIEVERWLALLHVPPADHIETIDRVLIMVRYACREMNRRTADQVQRRMSEQRAQAGRRSKR